MGDTVEIISNKVWSLENMVNKLAGDVVTAVNTVNANADINNGNFDCIVKWYGKQKKFNKFAVLAGIAGAYVLYKQQKEIAALKAKNEEQENVEK